MLGPLRDGVVDDRNRDGRAALAGRDGRDAGLGREVVSGGRIALADELALLEGRLYQGQRRQLAGAVRNGHVNFVAASHDDREHHLAGALDRLFASRLQREPGHVLVVPDVSDQRDAVVDGGVDRVGQLQLDLPMVQLARAGLVVVDQRHVDRLDHGSRREHQCPGDVRERPVRGPSASVLDHGAVVDAHLLVAWTRQRDRVREGALILGDVDGFALEDGEAVIVEDDADRLSIADLGAVRWVAEPHQH